MARIERAALQRGMVVRDALGRRFGTVFMLGDRELEVRHGLSAVHHLIPYEAVADLKHGEIWLRPGNPDRREGHLGFHDRTPASTIKPVATEAQLHSED